MKILCFYRKSEEKGRTRNILYWSIYVKDIQIIFKKAESK